MPTSLGDRIKEIRKENNKKEHPSENENISMNGFLRRMLFLF